MTINSKTPSIKIAIDGLSSCGKSTLAKALARQLNYTYVDSGAMYRAVTLHLMNTGVLNDGQFTDAHVVASLHCIDIQFQYNAHQRRYETLLNRVNVEREIRTLDVSKQVSAISTVREVREKLVAIQQKMGSNGGVVMDGRDIGTVVFPDAEVKLFIVANAEVRAERRYLELKDKGQQIPLKAVMENIRQRDEKDVNRSISPLKKADDALEIDNSELTEEEQLQLTLRIVRDKMETLEQIS